MVASAVALYSICLLFLDHNREILLTAGGCQALLHLVDKCADSSSDAHYKRVLCGCVLNFAADNGRFITIPAMLNS